MQTALVKYSRASERVADGVPVARSPLVRFFTRASVAVWIVMSLLLTALPSSSWNEAHGSVSEYGPPLTRTLQSNSFELESLGGGYFNQQVEPATVS